MKLMKKLKNQLDSSKKVTKHCKICFKEISDYSLFNLISNRNCLCLECLNSLEAKFISFKIGAISALAVYNYDDTIRKLIYTYKGCYDYELKDVFLNRYLPYLKLRYQDYIIVPAPSSEIDDHKRGYNHVEEIYKSLGLPIEKVLYKVNKEKQSSKSHKDRLKVNKNIYGKSLEKLKGKKVLVVDDIYTTGSTLLRCLEIIKEVKVKAIKVLVIAKTIDLDKRKKNEY